MTNKQNKINRLYYLLAFSSTLLTVNQLIPATIAHANVLITQNHWTQQQLTSHFTTNGSAVIKGNIFTLTEDQSALSGAAYQNTPIDLSQDFSMALQVNLGSKNQQHGGGDGLAFALVPFDHIDQVNHTNGGAFGLGRIANVFGFKLDTFYNASDDAGSFTKDPEEFGKTQGNGIPFGAFFGSDETGVIQTFSKDAKEIAQHDTNDFEPLEIKYQASTHTILINYQSKTWSYQITDQKILAQPISLVFSASTGANHNLQQIIIDHNDYHPFTSSLTVNYLDQSGNPLAPSQKISGALNDTYQTKPLSLPGFKLVSQPNNASGIFTYHDNQSIDYYYEPLTQYVTISFEYQGKILRKAIFSGQTGEQIDFSPIMTLTQLKDYTISQTDWPGSFVLPKDNNTAWHFTIHLTKKPSQTVINQNISPRSDSAANPIQALAQPDQKTNPISPQATPQSSSTSQPTIENTTPKSEKTPSKKQSPAVTTPKKKHVISNNQPYALFQDTVSDFNEIAQPNFQPSPASESSSFSQVVTLLAHYTLLAER